MSKKKLAWYNKPLTYSMLFNHFINLGAFIIIYGCTNTFSTFLILQDIGFSNINFGEAMFILFIYFMFNIMATLLCLFLLSEGFLMNKSDREVIGRRLNRDTERFTKLANNEKFMASMGSETKKKFLDKKKTLPLDFFRIHNGPFRN